jgi:small subunit ribosomal protein S20
VAHSVSARKRIRQNVKRQERNRSRKTRIKTEVHKLDTAVHAGNKTAAAAQLKTTSRVVDKVAAAGTIHRNKAARLKSRLAKRVNKLK